MIAVAECRTYDREKIREALEQCIDGFGGLEPYIRKGSRVLLKLNLVMAKDREAHATSHPEFVRALAEILRDYGCEVILGDSPGGLFNKAALHRIYKVTGIEKMAQEAGFGLNENTDTMEVSLPEGVLMKHLTMTAMLKDVDHVISVCKLKTHGMMTYSGAVKNMFGTIPGTVKADYHVRMSQESEFANALLDICEAAHPVLSFMDAIIGMEGNGPTAGSPREVGAVLAGPDPHELDVVAAGMIGLAPQQVPTLAAAVERGVLDPERIEVVGADPKQFAVPDFRMPDHIHTDLLAMKIPGFLAKPVQKLIRAKVHFQKDRCVGCGVCASNCPAKALVIKDHHPVVDHKACIRCFCCQELCPKEAVRVKESWIFTIANKL